LIPSMGDLGDFFFPLYHYLFHTAWSHSIWDDECKLRATLQMMS